MRFSGTASTDAAATAAAAEVLATVRSERAVADAAEAAVLVQVVAWAQLHQVEDPDLAATWQGRVRFGDPEALVPITSAGVPLVDADCVSELGTALGLSDGSVRHLIAQACELFCRLPRTWARVQAGDLPAWKGRRIAEHTLSLNVEAAGWVDVAVAPFAHRVGLAQLERSVEEAIATFMPEFAAQRREAAAEGRCFRIDHHQVSFAGTSQVYGELDLADALDLDAAVTAGAQQLKDFGSEETLDVRRARAVGELARRDLMFELTGPVSRLAPLAPQPAGPSLAPQPAGPSLAPQPAGRSLAPQPAGRSLAPQPAGRSLAPQPTGRAGRARREVVLYVHLSEAALTGQGGLGLVENRGPHLVTAETIRAWLGQGSRLGATTIRVRPVLDLSTEQTAGGCAIPDRIREHVELRDVTCVFPYCTRPARSCDLDHVEPYDHEHPARGGPTSTTNLAPLCRRHHRLKTKGLWTYRVLTPGSYAWTSPHGYTFLTDATGTTDTSPDRDRR